MGHRFPQLLLDDFQNGQRDEVDKEVGPDAFLPGKVYRPCLQVALHYSEAILYRPPLLVDADHLCRVFVDQAGDEGVVAVVLLLVPYLALIQEELLLHYLPILVVGYVLDVLLAVLRCLPVVLRRVPYYRHRLLHPLLADGLQVVVKIPVICHDYAGLVPFRDGAPPCQFHLYVVVDRPHEIPELLSDRHPFPVGWVEYLVIKVPLDLLQRLHEDVVPVADRVEVLVVGRAEAGIGAHYQVRPAHRRQELLLQWDHRRLLVPRACEEVVADRDSVGIGKKPHLDDWVWPVFLREAELPELVLDIDLEVVVGAVVVDARHVPPDDLARFLEHLGLDAGGYAVDILQRAVDVVEVYVLCAVETLLPAKGPELRARREDLVHDQEVEYLPEVALYLRLLPLLPEEVVQGELAKELLDY